MRVQDLLAAVRLMRGNYRAVYAVGLEGGALVPLHAAAIDNSISGVATVRTLISYQDILERPLYAEPLSSIVPCARAYYDLAELARMISPRPSVAVEPHDALRRPIKAALSDEAVVREILSGLHLRR